jgi:hypothetical protein
LLTESSLRFNREQIEDFGFELCPSHVDDFRQYLFIVTIVFPFFTGLGAQPGLEVTLCVLIEVVLVLFELAFEAKVGEDLGSLLPDCGDGLLEGPVVLSHEVGDDQSGRLHKPSHTLEMPAAQ